MTRLSVTLGLAARCRARVDCGAGSFVIHLGSSVAGQNSAATKIVLLYTGTPTRALTFVARDLRRNEAAEMHLANAYDRLRDPSRRDQCGHWLSQVRAAVTRSAPDG